MKPRLDDPAEYKIIKQIYFKNDRPEWMDIDPIERLQRMESRTRNNINKR